MILAYHGSVVAWTSRHRLGLLREMNKQSCPHNRPTAFPQVLNVTGILNITLDEEIVRFFGQHAAIWNG